MKQKRVGKFWFVVVALILVSMLIPACAVEEEEEEEPAIKNPSTFIIADIADVDSLDPAYGYDTASGEIVNAIYEPLVWCDGESTSDFVPVLATEWTVSEDGKTYRFKIREGVKFHNGNDLTPEDVEYSFERGMVQDYSGGPQWMFFEPLFGPPAWTSRTDDGLLPLEEMTSKVEVDGQWVQFNLAVAYEPFIQILAGCWGSIVDKEWCIESGDWDGTQESYEALNDPAVGSEPLHAIANGTGPYMLERWERGVEISLVRNDNYWGGPVSFERVINKRVDEWTTRKLMLEAGDADWVFILQAYYGELEGVEGIKVYENLPNLQADAFFFQFDITPESAFVGSGQLDGNGIPLDFFNDINVRKGFTYAFDWDALIEDGMQGIGQQIPSPIVEGLAYYNPDLPMYSHDSAKAEEYLRAAWDGQVWENGFSFTVAYNEGNLRRKTACEILQKSLFEINPKFRIGIQVMMWPTILSDFRAGLLPMYLVGWVADYPDAHNFVHPFMSSGGAWAAHQNYDNPEVDALIEQGILATDPAERQAIYDRLAEIYYEDAPGIMLAQIIENRYFRDWVQGFVFNPMDPSDVGHYNTLSKGY
ncbi:MAG TPA: ABC transporter substrate-binding protein [Dehalococcoidia bacterium]|nr:ABC transporter substrate-binding protein [Dehalococcoidia bacterium]